PGGAQLRFRITIFARPRPAFTHAHVGTAALGRPGGAQLRFRITIFARPRPAFTHAHVGTAAQHPCHFVSLPSIAKRESAFPNSLNQTYSPTKIKNPRRQPRAQATMKILLSARHQKILHAVYIHIRKIYDG